MSSSPSSNFQAEKWSIACRTRAAVGRIAEFSQIVGELSQLHRAAADLP